MIEMNQNAQRLYDLLFAKEFSLNRLEEELATGQYSADDVSLAGYKYVDDCDWLFEAEDDDWIPIERDFGELVNGYPSSYMVEVIELLLSVSCESPKT